METKRPNIIDSKTYYHIGNEYYDRGDYEKAIENYNMAILLNPLFSEAYFNRALSYYHLKNYDKGIADYGKCAELDPKNPIIYNNRGDAYYRKGDYASAIKDYDKAISLNPNYMKAFYNRGLSYASLEDYDNAVKDFGRVIELKPDFVEAYHLRGLAYEYAGDLDNAIAHFEKALSLNPGFTDAKIHLDDVKSKKETSGGGKEGTADIKLLQKPKLKFEDVAGMEKLKEEIREAIVYPLLKPELATKYGKMAGGGILMYGPPGCGKTYIVKAAAGECQANFINAKLSDLLDMYVGNTEKNIHKVFELARKNAPCIIFFDEVDAIGGRRDQQEGQQYMKMAVNQLLYEMDGIEANNQAVLVIAATNAPWDVDPALRRSGRFSKTLYVPEPDLKSRMEIIKLHSKKRPLAGPLPLFKLGLATLGYAAADLKEVVEEAASIPWREALKTGKERKVTAADYVAAVRKKKSSLPPWFEQAKKQIGKQEEVTIIDGKEHKKVTDSKMGPGEKEAFKDLLNVINTRNQWWWKIAVTVFREIVLILPIPF
ncbi:MAG: AAA family ATPase [Candidatus Anstonellales archaeon]